MNSVKVVNQAYSLKCANSFKYQTDLLSYSWDMSLKGDS